ncbi:MAG: IclR family transcriptional regulator [Haloplanus sp.]
MALKSAQNPIKATQTSFHILSKVAESDGATLSEITERTDVTKGAVFNHLATLQELGYVYKQGNRYRLSISLLRLAANAQRQAGVTPGVANRVCRLAETSAETAGYVVMEHEQPVVATAFCSSGSDQMGLTRGTKLPIESSAAGKAILSELSDETIRRIHDESGAGKDFDELRREITTVRSKGIALSRGETRPNRYSVAVPVSSPVGAGAAVTVCGPKDRLNGKALEQDIAGLVVKAADDIEVTLRQWE